MFIQHIFQLKRLWAPFTLRRLASIRLFSYSTSWTSFLCFFCLVTPGGDIFMSCLIWHERYTSKIAANTPFFLEELHNTLLGLAQGSHWGCVYWSVTTFSLWTKSPFEPFQLPRPNAPFPSRVTADSHAPSQQVVNYLHNLASFFFLCISFNTEPKHTSIGAPRAKQPQRFPHFLFLYPARP